MNSKMVIGVILVVIVVGGIYFLSKKQYQPSQTQPMMQQSATQPQTTAQANAVTIQNFAFNPGTLTVKQGTTVTWTNEDSTTHKIKSATFNSEALNQGDTFTFTFNTTGSFDYSCSIHPSMAGKIVVE